MASSFTVNLGDLNKILDQIKIAEQHAGNQDLNDPGANVAGIDLPTLIGPDAELLPVGLRTVSGIYNHLLPGQELVGSADQPFPRLLTPELRTGSGGGIDFNNDGIIDFVAPNGTNYNATGSVVDTQPRTISNLIVDQSVDNPAAVEAWFNNPLAVEAFELAHPGMTPVRPGELTDPLTQIEVTNSDLSVIPNQSPDIGLSPSFNGFMTFFGQFFDHGLDLVPKGGNGTVYIPLLPDDPLYDPTPGAANFMVVTRILPNAVNITTPFIDQNQTYTSHASHQVFLREYELDANGLPVSTGRLLSGSDGGLPKWSDVKAQAAELLGIQLLDKDVLNVPLLATDEYGRFIRGENGYVQIVTATGLVEGDPTANGGLGVLVPTNAFLAGTAFLDDIAHNAAPKPGLVADADNLIGTSTGAQDAGTYDDELLDEHFITGDGRGNENIGLTAVHTVFHNEHDRLVEANKTTILASNDLSTINQWLDPAHQLTALPSPGDELVWNGERLFQASRFVTEMQYQHLVFEEFARKIQPNVDPFIFTNSADLDPSIIAEFAHTVYRFGHSMLTDTVDRLDNDLTLVDGTTSQMGLIEAFLNPVAFSTNALGSDGTLTAADITAAGVNAGVTSGAILRGMMRQAGNEIDEFVVEALRNNLVGLPLDLAAINIARGRDAGIPSLNNAREELYAMTGDAQLKPYVSWFDFAQNLKHPASIINFIAAYGTHNLITSATTVADKRDAAMHIVFGQAGDTQADTDDFHAFLNSTGIYATNGGLETGLNNVDLWIGGLAEELMEFGGMLGSTFGAIFEYQMEQLQNGDRFYYLSRTQGMNLLNQLEATTFGDLLIRNTDLGADNATHMSALAFNTPDLILELDPNIAQNNPGLGAADPTWDNPFQQFFDPKVARDDLNTAADERLTHNYLKFSGGEHVVLGGTEGNDTLIGDKGIDTLWGDGGDDYLNAGTESDQVFGGEGDDIIEDPFGDNFLRGNQGNDVISSGHGLSILFGDQGQDFIRASTDTVEVFAGEGDDFILGGSAPDVLLGNEGDDWIEGGEGFDGLSGENSELFFNSPIVGHDILNGQGNDTDYDGENGDDIMFQSAGIQRSNGMDGFDWAIHKGDPNAADSDLGIRVFDTRPALILRDRFDSVEGLSGWNHNDILTGAATLLDGEGFTDALTQAGVDRIAGLRTVLNAAPGAPGSVVFDSDVNAGGEILLGGGGSDTIRGNLGNDIIDGDAWLNVRIAVHSTVVDPVTGQFGPGDTVLFSVDSLNEISARLLSRGPDHINPGQLKAVREILYDTATNGSNPADTNVDVALFSDVRANYTITRSGDRFIVAHTTIGAGIPDNGIDTLRNMEVARFADGDFSLINQAPTGVPIINDQTPTETIALNANALGVDDGNGIVGAFSYQWQSAPNVAGVPGTFTDIAGATNQAFTPSQGEVNEFLRVVVTFTDGLGNIETVTSAPTTSVVGDFFNGLAGTDIFVGTSGDDIANGNGGSDLLSGLAGNDQLNGGAADDILNGGAGNDTLNGGAGNNTASYDGATAGVSVSLAVAGAQNTGGAGTDTLVSIQNLIGSGQGDSLTGDANNNNISGGGGDDTIVSAGGNDTLTGGAGSDSLNGGAGAADVAVFAGAVGSYTVSTNAGNNIVVTADAGADGADTLLGIENLEFSGVNYAVVSGTTGNNPALTGGANSQAIFGLAGVDAIDGGAGNDLILGGTGNDTITQSGANGGRDIVNGGVGGNDTFVVNGNGAVEVYRVYARADAIAAGITGLNANSDIVITRNLNGIVGLVTNANVIAELDEIEEIVINTGGGDDTVLTVGNFNPTNLNFNTITVNGSTGNETVNVSGLTSPHRVVFTSNGGVDTFVGKRTQDVANMNTKLDGTSGNDVLITGVGNDTLNGNNGNDTLKAGSGIDKMAGGLGNDTYYVDNLSDVVIERVGEGTADTIISTVNVRLDTTTTAQGVENVVLQGTANATVVGNAANNAITGNAGNNYLSGLAGNDVINGGAGNDRIIGGTGNDTMTGGTGSDTFAFASGFGNDRIADFDAAPTGGQDFIDLSAFGITQASFAAHVGIFDLGADTLIVVNDFNQRILLAGINDATTITRSDFVLFAG